jgi:hypothetical protein
MLLLYITSSPVLRLFPRQTHSELGAAGELKRTSQPVALKLAPQKWAQEKAVHNERFEDEVLSHFRPCDPNGRNTSPTVERTTYDSDDNGRAEYYGRRISIGVGKSVNDGFADRTWDVFQSYYGHFELERSPDEQLHATARHGLCFHDCRSREWCNERAFIEHLQSVQYKSLGRSSVWRRRRALQLVHRCIRFGHRVRCRMCSLGVNGSAFDWI